MEKLPYYILNEQRRNKLPIYSYTVPEFVSYQMNMPIHNEQRELVYLLKKTRHRFLTQIAHMLLRYGMPYCYQVQTQDKIPIYKIECLFTGFRYTLLNCSTSEKLSINQHRTQLIEKIQTVTINGDVYRLEKDYACTGELKKNDETIATIRNLDNVSTSLTNRIRIEAIDDKTAALAAVLYHTFIYFGA
ncbi:hypothetical protein [Peribacillus simplex]|uniref:tubby C-terminal domain-like protein n=1 Tax=Peribacillus simplex TaxID=1478 RepID=UPI0012D98845|nr:hypothetical protein [Peribacillus simplex]